MANKRALEDVSSHRLPPEAIARLRAQLPEVSAATVEAVTEEVPGYRGVLDADALATLSQAVEVALGGFLSLAAGERDPSAPRQPALEGAYLLGRGEARSGRSLDALLGAYRVGARVAWRRLARTAADAGIETNAVVDFAELVFAYIDELSASSVAGHADELAVEERARQRHRDRLAHGLLTGAPIEPSLAGAQRSGWVAPTTLTAVLVSEDRVDAVRSRLDPGTLLGADELPDLPDGQAVLLVPDADDRLTTMLARSLAGASAVVGHPVPWLAVRGSYRRAVRAYALLNAGAAGAGVGAGVGGARSSARTAGAEPRGSDGGPDEGGRRGSRVREGEAEGTGGRRGAAAGGSRIQQTSDLLAELVVSADPAALADLRARVLAPLAGQRPATAERLTETLRAWLLHRGRREDVAAALFVHPQTVRYRVGQLRDLFGDALDDPRTTLELTVALALPDGAPVPGPAAEEDPALG